MKYCNLLAVLLLTFLGLTIAGKKSEPYKKEPDCVIETDFSTTETTLRSLIFQGKTKEAAKILARNETFGLAAGLTYLPEQVCAVVRTRDRRSDPDIVAIQAIALSAKLTGDTLKLANAIVLSFELSCRCSLFTSEEKDRLAGAWRGILEDPKEIQAILEFGGKPDPVVVTASASVSAVAVSNSTNASESVIAVSTGRRLQATEASPTDSFVCAYCDPERPCSVNNWCS